MARLRIRRTGPAEYWELAWFGPDLNPATGKKAKHTRNLGRRDTLSKRDAELALKALQRELFLTEHGLAVPVAPTVGAWATEYIDWHAAEFPDSHYRVRQIIEQHILPAWEMRRLDSITDRDVEDLKRKWRAEEFKDHTITKHLRTLKAFFNRAIEKKMLTASPAEHVDPPRILDAKPHLFYETEDLEALYLASSFDPWHPENSQHEPWHAPAWKLFANTGMRRGEGLALKRRWVGQDGLKIISTGEERTKSGDWRDVPLFPGALEALEALPKGGDYVLPRVAPESLSRAATHCIKRAGLPGSLHTLRHTFISHLARDPNVPIRTIQRWAGHASITTTEKYMYLRAGEPPIKLAL